MHVPCDRCGQLVSPSRADAVGAGYRCDLCSAIASGEERARVAHGRVAARRAVGGWLACVAAVPALALAGSSAAAAAMTMVVAIGAIAAVLFTHVGMSERKPLAPAARKSLPRST